MARTSAVLLVAYLCAATGARAAESGAAMRSEDFEDRSIAERPGNQKRVFLNERRFFPTEKYESPSSGHAMPQEGVPFFVTDEGMYAEMPESDIVYDESTGEVSIRNRYADRSGDAEKTSVEARSPTYFDTKPGGSDHLGFRNIKDFAVADSERTVMFVNPEESSGGRAADKADLVSSKEIPDRMRDRNLKNVDVEIKNISNIKVIKGVEENVSRDYSKANEENSNKSEQTTESVLEGVVNQHALVNRPTPASRTTDSPATEAVFSPAEKLSAESARSGKQSGRNAESDSITAFGQNVHLSDKLAQIGSFENQKYTPGPLMDPMFGTNKDVNGETKRVENDQNNSFVDVPTVASISELVQIGMKPVERPKPFSPIGGVHALYSTLPEHQDPDESKNDSLFPSKFGKPIRAHSEVKGNMSNEATLPGYGEKPAKDSVIVKTAIPVTRSSVDFGLPITTTEISDPLAALRTYLEDIYLRGPIAVVVSVDEDNLEKTREIWRAMEKDGGPLNIADVVLLGYNSDGITWMSHHKAANRRLSGYEVKSFRKALNGLKPSTKPQHSEGAEVALTRTARLLPYDSAAFLFGGQEDLQGERPPARLLQLVLSKRIKLYAVATGGWAALAARASGGAALRGGSLAGRGPRARDLRELSALDALLDHELDDELDGEEQTIVLRSPLSHSQVVSVPLDSSVRSLRVAVRGPPALAMLYGPEGIKLDLLDEISVQTFSPGSRVTRSDSELVAEVFAPRPPAAGEELQGQSEPFKGVWNLNVEGVNGTEFEVHVTADTSVRLLARLSPEYQDRGSLKVAVGGAVAFVREAILLDDKGQKMAKLPYRYAYSAEGPESDAAEESEAGAAVRTLRLPDLPPGAPFRLQVTGRNGKDETFVRISDTLRTPGAPARLEASTARSPVAESDVTASRGLGEISERFNNLTRQVQQTNVYDGPPLTNIQVGASTRLFGSPGSQMQLTFEVTNNRENAVYYRFGAKDDQYFLRTMVPQRQWINGGETASVTLTVGITSNSPNNLRDTITFTASGLEQTSQTAYVYVETDGRIAADRSRPSLRHDFRGDCLGYLDDKACASRIWAVDIVARDADSGLLRIVSVPAGLAYAEGFYAGSREEARARYTATCCFPSVLISASDINGNLASYEVNVAQYFTPATIAAIVLGVLLFIALVVAVALLVRMCLRRRRASRDLPSYQTQRAARTP